MSPHAAISLLLVAPPIFTAMPEGDDEDAAALVDCINDDVRINRMNARGRRDLRTLTGGRFPRTRQGQPTFECSRNDVIANIGVLMAAAGVWGERAQLAGPDHWIDRRGDIPEIRKLGIA